MSFPDDIKLAMRDCILKLLWPKDDIVAFFRSNSCTSTDIAALGDFKAAHRYAIVDAMFAQLSAKADGGLGQYRAMLQSLMGWEHFDPYYFDNLKKLNRLDAERSIAHLRQLQEIRDHKLVKQREERERKEAAAQAPAARLPELKARFIELLQGQIVGAKRGYALEDLLQDLCKLGGLETTEPFRVNGEQVDGAVKYDGEHYLIEAKWQEKAAANEPVYQFAAKVEGKMYGRGIFVSDRFSHLEHDRPASQRSCPRSTHHGHDDYGEEANPPGVQRGAEGTDPGRVRRPWRLGGASGNGPWHQ